MLATNAQRISLVEVPVMTALLVGSAVQQTQGFICLLMLQPPWNVRKQLLKRWGITF
ncbi:MAG: hypothetical protein K9K38_19470 [Rhodoferax sp.]|nr:hypothetical protein [Rhodoferax sp.]